MTDPTQDRDADRLYRPTGTVFITIAWTCLTIALIALAIGMLAKSTDILGQPDAAQFAFKARAMMVGEIFTAFWAGFMVAGYTIRAIWFLPGEDIKLKP